MTAGELVLVVAAVLCVIGFAALVVVLVRVLDVVRELRDEVASLRRETGPLVADLRSATANASTACSVRPRRSAAPSPDRDGSPARRCRRR
jgi:hypothetical protein